MNVLDTLHTGLAGMYALEREIGRGGMATVYLADDLKHQRKVAIKVLHPDLGAVLGAERFLSEIRVTANLQHPNLLPLFDSGAVEGLLYYVMPYVAGESLRARLDRERQLPVDEAVRMTIALAGALETAHQQGIIHRDLKPENILLQHGQPVIADFGIALAVSNAGGQRVTQTGLSLGTPQYMSPEQATGDRVIDARADVYSLAAVLYEMLSGEPPHTGTTAQAVIAKLLTEAPRALTVLRRNVPPHVQAAVERALEKLPADRFASAREFAEALEGRHFTPVAARGRDASPPRGWLAAAASVAVVCGIAGFAVAGGGLLRGERTAPPEPFARPLLSFDVQLPDSLGDVSGVQLVGADANRLFLSTSDGRRYLYSLTDRSISRVNIGSAFATVSSSPDGLWLLGRGPSVPAALTLIPGAGGTPRRVADSVRSSTWQNDSTLVVTQSRAAGIAISRLRIGTGAAEPELLSTVPHRRDADTVLTVNPVAIPGAELLLLELQVSPPSDRGLLRTALVLLDLETGRQKPVAGMLPAQSFALGVMANGYLLSNQRIGERTVFAAPFDWRAGTLGPSTPVASAPNPAIRNGTLVTLPQPPSALAVVDRLGRSRLLPGTEVARGLYSPQLSPDGTTLAYGVYDGEAAAKQIYTYRLPSGPATRIASYPARGGYNPAVRWAARGDAIYSRESSCDCLLRTARDGTRADTVAPTASNRASYPEVVPGGSGGERLLTTDSSGLRLIDPRADSVLARLATTGRPAFPAVSPDGQWVAYAAATGLYLSRLSGGTDRWRIPYDGVIRDLAWSRSGRELFFVGGDSLRVAALAFTPTPSVGDIRTLFPAGRYVWFGIGVLPGDSALVVPVTAGRANRVSIVVNFGDEVARLLGER